MRTRPRSGAALAVVLTALVMALVVPLGGQRLQSAGPGPKAAALASVEVNSDRDLARLAGFDLAEARHGRHIDVVLWPGDLPRLRQTGLPYRVEVSNLQEYAEGAGYRRLSDYEHELRSLAARFPDHVRLLQGPNLTWEGRAVLGVEIAERVAENDGRPVAMFLGLHHAREWPSGELTMDFARELAVGYGADPALTTLLSRVRVILVPVVNPDGFHYSRQSAVDQPLLGAVAGGQEAHWRKNRRGPVLGEQNLAAYGVDPNRNYGQHWGSGRTVLGSTSSNPFDQTYQGQAPFSEPEAGNVRQWILQNPVVALITNHTYSGLVLWPWGWSREESPDAGLLAQLGHELAEFNGYTAMQSSRLYPTTGTTEDWAYASTGTLGFTFEHGKGFHPTYKASYPHLYHKNRGAFLHLLESAVNESRHAVIEGRVVVDRAGGPVGVPARLALRRTGTLTLSPESPAGVTEVTDLVDLSMTAGPDGRFRWHVNPSTRPVAAAPEAYELTVTLADGRVRTMPVTVERGEVVDVGAVLFS